MPAAAARREAVARARATTSADHVAVHGLGVHRPRARRACASARARRRARRRRAPAPGSHPQAADVVDDRGAGVERGAGDVGLVGVDRERECAAGRARPAATGRTRASSSSARHRLGAGARRLAADVDEVGAVGLHAQRGVDRRAPDRARRPASANESGVTLRMPMTSGRSPRREHGAVRERNACRSGGRGNHES